MGAPTRLLDATLNPLIAAWFAVAARKIAGNSTDALDGRLFAFTVKSTIQLNSMWNANRPRWHLAPHARPSEWGTGDGRRVWRPPALHTRIPAQSSVFLLDGVPAEGSSTSRKHPDDASTWTVEDTREVASIPVRFARMRPATETMSRGSAEQVIVIPVSRGASCETVSRYPSAVSWWDQFWAWVDESQFRANLLAAAVFAVIAAVAVASVRRLREPVLTGLKRIWAFIRSIRLTTTKRIQDDVRRELEGPPKQHVFRMIPQDEYESLEKAQQEAEARAASNSSLLALLAWMQRVGPPSGSQADDLPVETDPVAWSARHREGLDFVLTNLSRTETAHHVGLRASGELTKTRQDPSDWYWPEVPPKATVHFSAMVWPGRPDGDLWVRVIWEDADGLAHESPVQLLGI